MNKFELSHSLILSLVTILNDILFKISRFCDTLNNSNFNISAYLTLSQVILAGTLTGVQGAKFWRPFPQ